MPREVTGRQRERTVVGNPLEPGPKEVHLSHQLASQAEFEVGIGELVEWLERGASCDVHHRVNAADAGEQRTDRRRIHDVNDFGCLVLACEYKVMAAVERRRNGGPNGTRSSHNQNSHALKLKPAKGPPMIVPVNPLGWSWREPDSTCVDHVQSANVKVQSKFEVPRAT